ncbi:MAG: endolytic transglycosylase MltG [Anaerolineales bacterium]
MPTSRARLGQHPLRSTLGILVAVMLLGLATGTLGFLCSALTAQPLASKLGPPAANLSWYEGIPLELYLSLKEADLQAPSAQEAPINFEILAGDTGSAVAARLHGEGWLGDPLLFRLYLRYTGGDRHLAPGIYSLPAGASARAIADALASGAGRLRELTLLSGWRSEEVPPSLASAGLQIPPQDFLDALRRRPGSLSLYSAIPPQATLEGFLFPDQYLVDPSANADLLVYQMVGRFDQRVDATLRSGFEKQGLTLYQAVILASIVQREVVVGTEMPVVTSVFLNRLARGMPLQADATIQYAIGFVPEENTWWKNPLSSEDLKIESPFNTYLHNGLPPSPIDNPGLAALQSVAHPAKTDYLYFRAACDGSGRHVFSETYGQHLAAACN